MFHLPLIPYYSATIESDLSVDKTIAALIQSTGSGESLSYKHAFDDPFAFEEDKSPLLFIVFTLIYGYAAVHSFK